MRTLHRSRTVRPDLGLGDWVTFDTILERTPAASGHGHTWNRVPYTGRGVLVGYRNKQNGRWESDNDDGWGTSSFWHATGLVPCALVACDLYAAPLVVPRGDLMRVAVARLHHPMCRCTVDVIGSVP